MPLLPHHNFDISTSFFVKKSRTHFRLALPLLPVSRAADAHEAGPADLRPLLGVAAAAGGRALHATDLDSFAAGDGALGEGDGDRLVGQTGQ